MRRDTEKLECSVDLDLSVSTCRCLQGLLWHAGRGVDSRQFCRHLRTARRNHGSWPASESWIPLFLRSFITQDANRMAEDSKSKPPVALTNAVSWRAEGIKHKKNEIFLDVVEKLNLLVAANGTVLHSEINGAVKMKSFLSRACPNSSSD